MATRLVKQAELARRLNTDNATVSRMLKGHDGLVSTWIAAADVIGYQLVLLPKDIAE